MSNSHDPAGKPGKTADRQADGPENKEAAAKATRDNDLTTGHSRPDDGGDDNAKGNK